MRRRAHITLASLPFRSFLVPAEMLLYCLRGGTAAQRTSDDIQVNFLHCTSGIQTHCSDNFYYTVQSDDAV